MLKNRMYTEDVMMLQIETGIKYGETVDLVPCRYTYVETEEPVETDEELIEE